MNIVFLLIPVPNLKEGPLAGWIIDKSQRGSPGFGLKRKVVIARADQHDPSGPQPPVHVPRCGQDLLSCQQMGNRIVAGQDDVEASLRSPICCSHIGHIKSNLQA